MAMESERRVARAGEDATTGEEGLLVNALVGAVVSIVLAFVPFSPVLGGAVAGYLQKGDDRTGVKVGAVSGAIAAIPVLAVLVLVAGFLSIVTVSPGGPGPGVPLAFGALLLVAATFVLVFTAALSAVGGFVGVVVARERETSAAPAAEPSAPTAAGAEPVDEAVTDEQSPAADTWSEGDDESDER